MMTQTHGATGIALWATGDALTRVLGSNHHHYYLTLAGALITWVAAKAPDIDNPDSRPGRQLNRIIPGASNVIERILGHRGPTHWISTGIVIGLVVGLLAHTIAPSWWWIGLATTAGWSIHIAGDCCTHKGAPAYGPFRRTPIRLPYGYRIECGGEIETNIIRPAAALWALLALAASSALATLV